MRIVIFLLLSVACFSQPRAAFDVASVKLHVDNYQGFSTNFTPEGGYAARNYSVWNLIRLAFDLRDSQIVGAPSWTREQGFDIQARPPIPVVREQTLLMIQSLLAERFHLKFHREVRQLSGYALRIASRGAKLPAAHEGPSKTLLGDFDVSNMRLGVFCRTLEFELDRPVSNETGLDGAYSIRMEWSSDHMPEGANVGKPSIFTALQEQLGLKLESARVPVEMFVVDGIEYPTAN